MKIVYLAGPMRGYPQYNFPAFHRAAAMLRERGYAVLSPAEHDLASGFDVTKGLAEQGFDLAAAFRWDVAALLEAQVIALLPGWEDSKGATLEHGIAQAIGLEIIEL